jgi:hypothetical protein
VSGIVVEGSGEPAAPAMSWPLPRPRPRIEHAPVRTGTAGKPITLSVRVVPASAARTVRLHYRPVNQLARFATLDAPANAATFTIPAEQVSPGYDLIYYFEVLHDDGGWFEPDPATQTPYHVVGIRR